MAKNKIIQMRISEESHKQISKEAKARSISLAEVMRQRVEGYEKLIGLLRQALQRQPQVNIVSSDLLECLDLFTLEELREAGSRLKIQYAKRMTREQVKHHIIRVAFIEKDNHPNDEYLIIKGE